MFCYGVSMCSYGVPMCPYGFLRIPMRPYGVRMGSPCAPPPPQELERQPGDARWLDAIEKDLHRQFPFHEMFAARGGHG